MKLLSASDNTFVFRLGKREKQLLTMVLRRYPLIPEGYHRLTRAGATSDDQSSQALLDEVLTAQRQEHRHRVDRLLEDPARLAADHAAYRLTLKREDLEWLLQVLNDVRVGSWIKAGCPDPEEGKPASLTAENAPHFLVMEVAGQFECVILDAL